MQYRNTRTGAIICSPCVISGGDWVKVTKEAKSKEPKVTESKVTEPKVTESKAKE